MYNVILYYIKSLQVREKLDKIPRIFPGVSNRALFYYIGRVLLYPGSPGWERAPLLSQENTRLLCPGIFVSVFKCSFKGSLLRQKLCIKPHILGVYLVPQSPQRPPTPRSVSGTIWARLSQMILIPTQNIISSKQSIFPPGDPFNYFYPPSGVLLNGTNTPTKLQSSNKTKTTKSGLRSAFDGLFVQRGLINWSKCLFTWFKTLI